MNPVHFTWPRAQGRFSNVESIFFTEFTDLSDFIWKNVRFIDAERRLEEKKLIAYFPLTGDADQDEVALPLRAFRAEHEFRLLDSEFPTLNAHSNFLISASLFEAALLGLSKETDGLTEVSLQKSPGQGIQRAFSYLKVIGIVLSNAKFYEQIVNGIKFRNCLIHASGNLEWSRDQDAIEDCLKNKTYLESWIRKNVSPNKAYSPIVDTVEGHYGSRLRLSHGYSNMMVSRFRETFMEYCEQAEMLFPG